MCQPSGLLPINAVVLTEQQFLKNGVISKLPSERPQLWEVTENPTFQAQLCRITSG